MGLMGSQSSHSHAHLYFRPCSAVTDDQHLASLNDTIFTTLRAVQTRFSDKTAVCLPSVCQIRGL